MDLFDLRPGDPWEDKTREAISRADVVVVCVSRNSNSRTGFLEKETAIILAEAAEKLFNFVLPVRFDDSPVPKILEPYYYIDLFAEGGYEKLRGFLTVLGTQIREGTQSQVAVPVSGHQQANASLKAPRARQRSHKPDVPPNDATTAAEKSFPDDELLHDGSKGELVTAVQQRLREFGYKVFADGTYGPSTKAAVLEFQETNNLRSTDGLVGPNTWAALFGQEPVERKAPSTLKRKSASRKSSTRANAAGRAASNASATIVATPGIIKEGLDEEARERKALNDKPVTDVDKDTLGFRPYVCALRDFIKSQSTTTPLTISINGAWGSGKSSLMRMLQNQLEPDPGTRWQRLKQTLRWLKQTPRRLLQKEVKRDPPEPMWEPMSWIKVRWLAGYFYGTVFYGIGRLLVRMKVPNSDYIKLAFAFAPDEDVTGDNFDQLFAKCVEFSIKQDFRNQNGDPQGQQRIDTERKDRAKKTRFWARQAARRRKMTPPAHPTIWFNAWKFNQQEQLWAALATAVLEQLKGKYGFFTRLYLLTKLTWKRTDKLRAVNQVSRKLILPVIVAGLVALYYAMRQPLINYFYPLPHQPPQWLSKDTLLWLAPVLAAMWQAIKAIDDPFKIPIDELMTSPDYKGKVGFIGTFEQDFGRIVDVAIRRSIFWKPRKLVIFIDDLDRCGPTQAAGIVEAINLFLDSVGCVFVLGMDMNAVAISIEVKYKELTERMREDAPDDVAPGVLFLDKIVQIPFNVPRPNKTDMKTLVGKITETESRELPAIIPTPPRPSVSSNGGSTTPQAPVPASPQAATTKAAPTPAAPKVDRAGFAQEDIRQAIAFATGLLKENPRQAKRFINLFRLQVYIADERELLSDKKDRLNPQTLAVWVAWYMQWPEIVKLLAGSAQSEELRQNLATIAAGVSLPSESQVVWQRPKQTNYFKKLKTIREREKSSASHWSNLPWQLWTRDSDFLRCLKELEHYWQRSALLNSMLDMTQVTVSEPAPAAEIPPPVAAITSAASVPA
jgi:hypothetical protein